MPIYKHWHPRSTAADTELNFMFSLPLCRTRAAPVSFTAEKMADLSKIPLVALSIDTRILISTLLNPTKVLTTDDGLPRDWRGLAHLCDIGGEKVPWYASQSDPTAQLLAFAENNNYTVKDLGTMLTKIERWDVIDDSRPLMERDAARYTERMERCRSSADGIEPEIEAKILTMDDLYRVQRGMENQCYDAFVLYADEDMDFVTEMTQVLEKKQGLKLCLKDRDLMGGITFEHEAVMRLISERCNRLIVVISPDFRKSPANAFFLNYAQAVGIGTGQRKIIPCLYKKCELPPQLAYQFILDYGKNGLYDFWARLGACVRVTARDSDNGATADNHRLLTSRISSIPVVEEEVNGENRESDENKGITMVDDRLKAVPIESPSSIVDKRLKKSQRNGRFLAWSKSKAAKKKIEPVTETISITLSLPSLDDLSSLDSVESAAPSDKSTKRKKNLVGTCLERVQTLLTKQT